MLEQPALLLRPWAPGDALPRRVWVVDPTTDAVLGSARRRGGRGRFARLRWWGRPVIEVRESDDEPLLFTMWPGWGFAQRWRVEDAEGGRVGRVAGPFLLDRRDAALAVLRRGTGGTSYQDAHGRELAETEVRNEGICLTFLPDGQGSPFVKMLLLAAALVHNEAALGDL
ncbi:MAG: hypothetical protein HYS12_27690 [Planctomycetes bacterium]|nr:hypothetical protein [Planctomycetota bacterium]